jgi:hypothetical protein
MRRQNGIRELERMNTRTKVKLKKSKAKRVGG